ncbi:MAG TPA: hypothetical protein EYP08_02950 [Pyrodictiaceae archaeon]|nr:hypothetical protein [Pyrodictiaceae archaeon]HIQ11121.1 hypothetical protein [Pyrodictium sp.]HIQ55764.1 hypothetical protein [Pyrodictium sp.]
MMTNNDMTILAYVCPKLRAATESIESAILRLRERQRMLLTCTNLDTYTFNTENLAIKNLIDELTFLLQKSMKFESILCRPDVSYADMVSVKHELRKLLEKLVYGRVKVPSEIKSYFYEIWRILSSY